MEKDKVGGQAAKGPESADKPLEFFILDYPKSKYEAIPLAAEWAQIIRRKEENRHMTPNEVLEMAIRDVLSEKVTLKDVRKASVGESAESPDALLNGADKSK